MVAALRSSLLLLLSGYAAAHGGPAKRPSALSSLLSVEHVGRALASLEGGSAAPVAALLPFNLSAVTLAPASRLGVAQQRNHEYLLALNDSQLTCIFTSAANLTRCEAADCPSPGGGADAPLCEPLPGEMGLGSYYGHYLGHYLSATAMMAASTGDAAVAAKGAGIVAALAKVQAAWGTRYPADGSGPAGLDGAGYLFPYDPFVFRKLEDLTLHAAGEPRLYSVPFYTLHKMMAGLLDQCALGAGNAQACAMVRAMGDWVVRNVRAALAAPGGQGVWQQVLGTEWGGMNEVMFNLHARWGDAAYLEAGRAFNHFQFSAPLAAGLDDLDGGYGNHGGNHANTHIPEVIGNLVGYELTGNATDKAIGDEFFAAVTQNHSWATGGSNDAEHWQAARRMGDNLNADTEESCTQYNVLKVARHLLAWGAGAELADFYERALYNGILGNQNQADPSMTQFIYMLPLGGGGIKKPWGRSDQGFPCCWGTLSEQFSKLGDSIFFTDPQQSALYVSLFASAAVRWDARPDGVPVTVTQSAGFPESRTSTTKVTINLGGQASTSIFALHIRVPGWATNATANVATLTTAGGATSPVAVTKAGSWLAVERPWADGDSVEVYFPLGLWAAPLEDDRDAWNATLAFMYGPLVLAGLTSEATLIPADAAGKPADARDPASFIARDAASGTAGERLSFTAHAVTMGAVPMVPLLDVVAEAYTVYFDTRGAAVIPYTPGGALLPSNASADFKFEGGAGMASGPRDARCSGLNLRTGQPGEVSTIAMSHLLLGGAGTQLDAVSLSFRWAAGYTPRAGTPPAQMPKPPVVTVVVIDAASGKPLGAPLFTSAPLGNVSFDRFEGYAPPVVVRATGLALPNEKPLIVALQVANRGRNLMIPLDDLASGFNITVGWTKKDDHRHEQHDHEQHEQHASPLDAHVHLRHH